MKQISNGNRSVTRIVYLCTRHSSSPFASLTNCCSCYCENTVSLIQVCSLDPLHTISLSSSIVVATGNVDFNTISNNVVWLQETLQFHQRNIRIVKSKLSLNISPQNQVLYRDGIYLFYVPSNKGFITIDQNFLQRWLSPCIFDEPDNEWKKYIPAKNSDNGQSSSLSQCSYKAA